MTVLTKRYLEILIGLVVIVALFFIMFYVFGLGAVMQDKNSYSIVAQFKSITGISPGSDVVISGVPVGKVYSVSLNQEDYYYVTVKMSIKNAIKIPRSSVAIISSNSILAENKYIKIELMDFSDSDFLQDGDKIVNTQSSVNIIDMIMQKFLS